MSFRVRLIMAVLMIGAITFGGAFVLVYIAVGTSELRQLDAALLEEAWEEAAEVGSIGGKRLAISPRPGPLGDDTGPLTKFAAIYRESGEVIDYTPTFQAGPPKHADLPSERHEPFVLFYADESLRAVVVPVPGHHGTTLLLAAPHTYIDEDLTFLSRTLVLLWLGALALTAIVVSWIMGRLTRDHATIAAAMRRVANGDLSTRVKIREQIGETAQLARDLNEMIERVGTLVDTQRRFIAHASHELRSPLTLLYGELSFALRRPRDAEAYREAIEEALDSARSLKRLTEHLLTLTRLKSENDSPGEPIDLHEVACVMVQEVQRVHGDSDGRVKVTGKASMVVGVKTDLERVVFNLVENALRYTPKGSGVSVEVETCGDRVELRVCDEGVGVAEEDRERIFEPFYRSAHAGDVSGSGLGLAIVRETARAHGGEARYQEAGGGGACLVVDLPRAPSELR